MESPKHLYNIEPNQIKLKSHARGVYFKKPRLVAYYAKDYDSVEPAKKILYFKKLKSQSYPIDLNLGYLTYTERKAPSPTESLNLCLKYLMSEEYQLNFENVGKIKIITRRGTLVDLMEIFYQKKYLQCKIRVSRYNGDLYVVRDKDCATGNSDMKQQNAGINIEPRNTHESQLLKNVFTESLYNDPNINEPHDANKGLFGVHESSFAEFGIIYSGHIYGIEAEDEIGDFDDMKKLNDCHFVLVKQLWSTLRNNPLKHLNYWLQAYLANATDLYFAYKESNGVLYEPIIHKRLSEIPKKYMAHWTPCVCTGFLYKLLQEINELMSNDNINSLTTVYEFNIDLRQRTVTYKIFKDKPLVTSEYIEYCEGNL